MKTLVRFLLIFTCLKLIISKPQHLQQQTKYNLDPVNQPEFEYPPKDPGKRTIGSSRHYAFGKHVGIHPHGYKYVLGYSPINVKYVPVIKPVTVLKPVLQHSIRPSWKPIRHYLPPLVHIPKPIHQVDHGWKPVVPVAQPIATAFKPWLHQFQQIHPVVEEQVVKPPDVIHEVPAPVVAVKPALPALPDHSLHNYYFFQTPVARPSLLHQSPFFHLARPQLPVLPLGASFPAPVLHSAAPVQFPNGPTHFPNPAPPPHVHPVAPVYHHHPATPIHHHHPVAPIYHHHPVAPSHHQHPVAVQPPVIAAQHPFVFHQQPVVPDVPVHHPIAVHPQSVHPFIHNHNPAQPVAPVPAHPQPAALPPISVEFHGNRHLVPFNNQFPFTSIQSSVPFPRIPEQTPQVVIGRQPHALPLPPQFVPEIQHSVPEQQVPSVAHPHVPTIYQPQAPFNPAAAIQPGETDVQVPQHLPDHTQFSNHGINLFRPAGSLEPPNHFPENPHFGIHDVNHFHPTGSLEPPFPPFQNPGNTLRPSISLEPPYTHEHN